MPAAVEPVLFPKSATVTPMLRRTLPWLLVTLTAGCVLPARRDPADVPSIQGRIALLPVSLNDVMSRVPNARPEPAAAKLLKLTNRSLNHLASTNQNIVGPDQCLTWAKAAEWETLNASLKHRAPNPEVPEHVIHQLRNVGVTALVRTEAVHEFRETGGTMGAVDFGGSVSVRMELYAVDTLRFIVSKDATAHYEQTAGLLFVVPFYFGESVSRAVDGAARRALSNLFASMEGKKGDR